MDESITRVPMGLHGSRASAILVVPGSSASLSLETSSSQRDVMMTQDTGVSVPAYPSVGGVRVQMRDMASLGSWLGKALRGRTAQLAAPLPPSTSLPCGAWVWAESWAPCSQSL